MDTDETQIRELFPGLPATRQPAKPTCTRMNYIESCKARYHTWTMTDARRNWDIFEEHRETFRAWCDHYRRDPQMFVGVKAHNPEGTLSAMVWVMQVAINPDRSVLSPCLDLEEHFQKIFIRRGLIIYLTLLLNELEGIMELPPDTA